MQLIVQNLLGNAVKYTKKGRVRIITSHLPSGGCRITVADNGPGIPKEQLEKIFQPYTRGPTYGQSGMGLGLTIAHEASVLLKGRDCGRKANRGMARIFISNCRSEAEDFGSSRVNIVGYQGYIYDIYSLTYLYIIYRFL